MSAANGRGGRLELGQGQLEARLANAFVTATAEGVNAWATPMTGAAANLMPIDMSVACRLDRFTSCAAIVDSVPSQRLDPESFFLGLEPCSSPFLFL